MTITLMFKNLRNFITRSPLAFLVIVVLEVAGTVGLIVTYGIVRNVFTEQQKAGRTARWMNFYNCVWNEEGGGTLYYWDSGLIHQTMEGLMNNEAKDLLDDFDLYGKLSVDGKEYSAGCSKVFRRSKGSQMDADIFEAYKKGENIVAVKTYYYPCSVGDVLNINGKDYRVYRADDSDPNSGAAGLAQVFFFPYDSAPKEMEYYELTLDFTDIPTHKQADAIAERLIEDLNFTLPVNMPEIPNLLVQQFNTTMLAGCGLAAVLIAFNCITVYMYIIRKRSDWIAVVKLCGCKNGGIVGIMLSEILLVSCACFGIGALISAKLLIPKLTDYYPLFDQFYTAESYRWLFLGLAGMFALVTLIQLSPFVRRSVDSMRKGGI